MLIGPPSEMPNTAACSLPTASITARTSSMRSSSVAIPAIRSESPLPRLSNRMSREKEVRRCVNRVMGGGLPPMLNVRHKAGHAHHIEKPMAEHLIGDKDVAASRIMGLWWKHPFSLPA